ARITVAPIRLTPLAPRLSPPSPSARSIHEPRKRLRSAMNQKLQAIRGMADVLPEASPLWQKLEDAARTVFERYGYRNMRTPIVEPTALFVRGLGEVTDIVEKEMY